MSKPVESLSAADRQVLQVALGMDNGLYGFTATPPAAWSAAWTLAEWEPTSITVYPDRRAPYADIGITPEALFDLFSVARLAPVNTYYVDTATGNDANAGTSGSKKKTIHAAVTAANSAGSAAKIIITAGEYIRTENPSNGNNVLPTVDIAYIATGGRVITGAFDTFTNPTADATYTNTYSAVLTNVNRIMDRKVLDRFGDYTDLTLVGSAAICNITPNSWYYNTGTNTYYINRADGAAPTSTNTRLFRSSVGTFKATSPLNFFFGGVVAADGFDFEGGNSAGCLNYAPTTKPASNKAVIASNCSFKYAGGRVDTGATGVAVNSIHGLSAFFNSHQAANWTDGFNCHNSTTPTAVSHFMTVNCSGFDNGRGLAQSCNGWTTHEDVTGADFCGVWDSNRGGSMRSINTSVSWIVGSLVKNDLGDISLGGVVPPTAIQTDNTAAYYLDRVEIDMPSGSRGLYASSGSSIYTRNMRPRRQADQGAGTIGTY